VNVLLTHLWPETNSGDYAIVRGTIDAIENSTKQPVSFIGLTTFASHSANISNHFPETLAKGVELRPALVPGYKNDQCGQFSTAEKIWLSLSYLAITVLLAIGWPSVAKRLVSRSQRETLSLIAGADLVVIKGGAFIMGFPGIVGTLYLLRNCLTVMWCAKLNNNCFIAPHSFGPLANGFQCWLLRFMLKDVRIYVREHISLELLNRVGLKAKYLPDMAFYFDSEIVKKCRPPQIAATVRPCPTFLSEKQEKQYYNDFAETISVLIDEGYKIVFVPQVTGPDQREDDRVAIQAIKALIVKKPSYSSAVSIATPSTLQEKFRIYGESVCCVGTRMHSVIFSCLVATKVVALAYLGPKHLGIMADLNLGDFVLDITNFSPEQLLAAVHNAIEHQDVQRTSQEVVRMRAMIKSEFENILAMI